MSNETELRTFMRLETAGRLAWSQVPITLRRSPLLRELLEAGLLVRERRGAGQVLLVAAPVDFSKFLDHRFPGRHSAQAGNTIDNVQRYATPLKKKAVITRRLRATDHAGVAQVLTLLADTNRFLEQQALFADLKPPDQ